METAYLSCQRRLFSTNCCTSSEHSRKPGADSDPGAQREPAGRPYLGSQIQNQVFDHLPERLGQRQHLVAVVVAAPEAQDVDHPHALEGNRKELTSDRKGALWGQAGQQEFEPDVLLSSCCLQKRRRRGKKAKHQLYSDWLLKRLSDLITNRCRRRPRHRRLRPTRPGSQSPPCSPGSSGRTGTTRIRIRTGWSGSESTGQTQQNLHTRLTSSPSSGTSALSSSLVSGSSAETPAYFLAPPSVMSSSLESWSEQSNNLGLL